MPRSKKMEAGARPASRVGRIALRVDADLLAAAYEKALQYGGLSAVIRAMLRKFVKGEPNFDLSDLADENRRARKTARKQ